MSEPLSLVSSANATPHFVGVGGASIRTSHLEALSCAGNLLNVSKLVSGGQMGLDVSVPILRKRSEKERVELSGEREGGSLSWKQMEGSVHESRQVGLKEVR